MSPLNILTSLASISPISWSYWKGFFNYLALSSQQTNLPPSPFLQQHCFSGAGSSVAQAAPDMVRATALINIFILIKKCCTNRRNSRACLGTKEFDVFGGRKPVQLTPEFQRALNSYGTPRALFMLRKSLALRLNIALIILGLVAWLGTLEQPVSM